MTLLGTAINEDIPRGSVILYGVLNWGLGHASRSVAVIKALLGEGHVVHVATDGICFTWMQQELTGVTWHELPETAFTFPGNSIWDNAGALIPAFLRHIRQDSNHVQKLVKKIGADVIISDNRFVFRDKHVKKNIYITHQCRIYHRSALFSRLLTAAHRFFIRRFDVCWVPDDPERKLAGILSDRFKMTHIRYIGFLRRMTFVENARKPYDFLFLISGPEPQRSRFEEEIVHLGLEYDLGNVCLIRGSQTERPPGLARCGWDVYDLAETFLVQNKLASCRVLVCRSGYSTLMDISDLQAKIVLVPTPGQTEQEYLAENSTHFFRDVMTVSQSRFRSFFYETFLLPKKS